MPLVSGAAEALPALRDTGLVGGPVVFDSDVEDVAEWSGNERVETDSLRARERYFGAVRGQDVTSGLDALAAAGADDFLPVPDLGRRSLTTVSGARVEASGSVATDLTWEGLDPASRPAAAFDGDPTTAWRTHADRDAALVVRFEGARSLAGLRLTPIGDHGGSPPTKVSVSDGRRSVVTELRPEGVAQSVGVPDGTTSELRLRILDTRDGPPASTTTGLAEVTLAGLAVRETVDLPEPVAGRTGAVVITRQSGAFPGCVLGTVWRCLTGATTDAEESVGLRRSLTLSGDPTAWQPSGSLVVSPRVDAEPIVPPGVDSVTASSVRTADRLAAPDVLVDSDETTAWGPGPGDTTPTIHVVLDSPREIRTLRVAARDGWLAEHAPLVARVTVDGFAHFATLRRDGTITVPASTGRRVDVSLLGDPVDLAFDSLEVSSLDLGAAWGPLPAVTGAPCGQGPRLSVDGAQVPTKVVASSDGLRGIEPLLWSACSTVDLPVGRAVTVELLPWRDAAPSQILLRRSVEPVAGSLASAGQPLAGAAVDGHRRGQVAPGPARLLVLDANSNPGWRARLAGTELTRQTVDGFRQGWVVPEGASGSLDVDFAPDTLYRRLLLAGAAMAVALVALALRREGRPRAAMVTAPRPGAPGRAAPWPVLAVTAVAGGVLVAGWPGATVGVIAVFLGRRPGWLGHPIAPVVLVGLPLLAAGAVQAFASPGALGPPPVEALTRLLTLLAVLLAVLLAAGATGAPHQRLLDEAVAEPREQDRGRTAHRDEREECAEPAHEDAGAADRVQPHEDRDVPQEDAVGDPSEPRHPRATEALGDRALRAEDHRQQQ